MAVDNVHGASFITRRCIEILSRAAQVYEGPEDESFRSYLVYVGRALSQAQPAMCAPGNRIAGLLEALGTDRPDCEITGRKVEKEVKACLGLHDSELGRLGQAGAVLLAEKFREKAGIITLSHSDAVYAVLSRLAPNSQTEITVAESRPLCEGVTLAKKLAADGFTVNLVTDATLGIETAGASCVLVGADTVFPDGGIINKAGTRLLALAAKMDNIPFYCCTQTCKVLPIAKEGTATLLFQKEGDPAELIQRPAAGIRVRNQYYDRTEYFLVSGFITERGFMRCKEIGAISRRLAEVRDRVFGKTARE